MLLTLGIGQVWAESIEINTSNSGVNGSYRDYTFDVNSVTFGCTQWMKNNNIQAKKSITNSLYNVDAIPGTITSIVVKQTNTARAIKIYGGTASKPTTQITSPSTAAEMTFDFTGKDYTYFSLTTPGNACYFDKITINYTPSSSGGDPEPEPDPTPDPEEPDPTPGAGSSTGWVETAIANIASSDLVVVTMTSSSGTYAMSNDKGTGSAPAAVKVTVNGDKLSEEPADNLKWNITYSSGSLTIYPNGDSSKWLYCTGTNNGTRVGTNTSKTFTIEGTYLKHTGTSRYVGVYNNQDWRCYTSSSTNIGSQTLKFYKYVAPSSGDEPETPKTDLTDDQFAWSAATAEATMGASNTFPTLTNTLPVSVTYESSTPATATIAADGTITLVAPGTTTISAKFAGGEVSGTTYAAKTVTYALTVKKAPLDPIAGGVIDILNQAWTGKTNSTYGDVAEKTAENTGHSNAKYVAQCAGDKSSIQLRSNNSNSGVVSTISGGVVKRIEVEWHADTDAARTLQIYGSNTAYTAATDLYGAAAGELLGELNKGEGETTLDFSEWTGDYKYIGFRSKSGAMYLTTVTITWLPTISKVTIADPIKNGSISVSGAADLNSVAAGTVLTLSNTPSADYKLSAYDVYKTDDATIKVTVDGNTFVMPEFDVTISATFELAKTLTGIEITNAATQITFWQTETFNHNGLKVTAHFNGAEDEDVTSKITVTGSTATAGTQTVTISYKEGATTETATYNITVKATANTQETAYNVATAREIIDAVSTAKDIYVTGVVSEIVTAYNSQYGNISYNISADGLTTSDQLLSYRGKSYNGENFTSDDDIQVGDEVVVKGNLKLYEDTYEFDAGNQLVSLNRTKQQAGLSYTTTEYNVNLGDAFTAPTLNNPHTLAVTYSSNNEDVATVAADGAVTIKAAGTVTITASFAGNASYAPGEASYTIKVVGIASLPFAFDGKYADIANTAGMSQEGIDLDDYASSPHLKINTTGDYLTIHFDSEPDKLTYDIKGNSFSGGTFTVQESADGETYTTIATYTELGEKVSEEKELESTSRYVKFIYTKKVNGNVALGNISITKPDTRKDAGLAWSEETVTLTVGDAFTAPTLNNPNSVSDITYESSNEDVATVSDAGVIDLVDDAVGTATITASFAGDATYKPATATCTIEVKTVQEDCEGSDDFETATATNASSYNTRTTDAGWKATNAAKTTIEGYTYLIINGKTSAVGTITSPELNGGIGSIKIRYANTYGEDNGVSFRLDIKQGDAVVKTYTITKAKSEVIQNTVYTELIENINIEGDFVMVFTNLSPSNSTSNKDRVSIGRLCWTGYTAPTLVTPSVEKGIFSVADDRFVQFSTGNLQYEVGTNTWSFAANQYDYIGEANINVGDPDFTGTIDLFGWSTNDADNNYGVNPNNVNELYDGTFQDWGTKMGEGWSTLSADEWKYLLNTRANAKNLKQIAKVGNVVGIMLFPDAWTMPTVVNVTAAYDSYFKVNIYNYDLDQWDALEKAGAVFLPAAGRRAGGYGNMINKEQETETNSENLNGGHYKHYDNGNIYCYYWTSTINETTKNVSYLHNIQALGNDEYTIGTGAVWGEKGRYGQSVRLVKEVTPNYTRDVRQGYYGTICLPTAGQMVGASIFEIAYKDASKIYFDEIVSGKMEAGIPYILLPNEGVTTLKVFYTEMAVVAAGRRNGLVGYYNNTDDMFNVPIGNYILLNNQYCEVVGMNAYIMQNYSYIVLDDVPDPDSAPALAPGVRRVSMGVTGQNTATGVDQVQGDEVPTKMIINGQLYILRGEKMYDAQGKLVK